MTLKWVYTYVWYVWFSIVNGKIGIGCDEFGTFVKFDEHVIMTS